MTNENFPNVIFAKDSLLLSGVSREDEGTWTCIASNIAGSDSISHQLLIEWAPKVRIGRVIHVVGNGSLKSKVGV